MFTVIKEHVTQYNNVAMWCVFNSLWTTKEAYGIEESPASSCNSTYMFYGWGKSINHRQPNINRLKIMSGCYCVHLCLWSVFEGVEVTLYVICVPSPSLLLTTPCGHRYSSSTLKKKVSLSSSFLPLWPLWEEHLWSQKGQIGLPNIRGFLGWRLLG